MILPSLQQRIIHVRIYFMWLKSHHASRQFPHLQSHCSCTFFAQEANCNSEIESYERLSPLMKWTLFKHVWQCQDDFRTVQTFAHNSILLTGLEFNCTVSVCLCRRHWLLIEFNVIRNCIQKFVLKTNISTLMTFRTIDLGLWLRCRLLDVRVNNRHGTFMS